MATITRIELKDSGYRLFNMPILSHFSNLPEAESDKPAEFVILQDCETEVCEIWVRHQDANSVIVIDGVEYEYDSKVTRLDF